MTRQRLLQQQPWYQRYARPIIGAIALAGTVLTAYLTTIKLLGIAASCGVGSVPGAGGCNDVLDSAYAQIAGIPLPLFGCLAYLSMAVCALGPLAFNPETQRARRRQLETATWWLLLVGGFVMATFSSYLMYILASELQAVCLYCIGSALLSTSLLLLVLTGHDWEDLGQVAFAGVIVITIVAVGAFGIYAGAREPQLADVPAERMPIPPITTTPQPGRGWEISTASGPAEMALAEHLNRIGAKKYGAYWCPHCYEQKQLFGAQALAKINYVECDRTVAGGQPEACQAAGVRSYPTWEINGQLYSGTQTLERLAELSGYQGPQNFRYFLGRR